MAEQESSAGSVPQPAPGNMTLWQAVSEVLKDKGTDLTPMALSAEVKQRFGMNLGPNTAKSYKRDFISKQGKGSKPAASNGAEKSATPAAAPTPAPAAAAAPPGLTKKEAVLRAIKIAGPNADTAKVQRTIKAEFNMDISANHISAVRSKLRQEKAAARAKPAKPAKPAAAKKAPPKPAPKAKPAARKTPAAPSPAVSSAKPAGFRLDDIQTARTLLARLGNVRAQQLIDVLTK
jgi:hypothetical protein